MEVAELAFASTDTLPSTGENKLAPLAAWINYIIHIVVTAHECLLLAKVKVAHSEDRLLNVFDFLARRTRLFLFFLDLLMDHRDSFLLCWQIDCSLGHAPEFRLLLLLNHRNLLLYRYIDWVPCHALEIILVRVIVRGSRSSLHDNNLASIWLIVWFAWTARRPSLFKVYYLRFLCKDHVLMFFNFFH